VTVVDFHTHVLPPGALDVDRNLARSVERLVGRYGFRGVKIYPSYLPIEVSGLPPRRLLDYFPRLATIPGKVVFGSDFPVVRDLAANVDAVRRLPLPDGFADDVLGGAALRLLGAAS
jgi:predicted TIM-barrel fold metal-dependent hydrolase